MRIFILIAVVSIFVFVGCDQQKTNEISTDLINNNSSANKSKSKKNNAAFDFEETVIEFGEISQGEKVKKRYRFKNSGNADLIISNASGSCGCTIPVYPKEPIKPGAEGEIEVVFNSNGKRGHIHNTITLIANTIPNKTILALKGEVLTPNK